MSDLLLLSLTLLAAFCALCVAFLIHAIWIGPRSNPLRRLPGPPTDRLYDNTHMSMTVE